MSGAVYAPLRNSFFKESAFGFPSAVCFASVPNKNRDRSSHLIVGCPDSNVRALLSPVKTSHST